MAQEDYLSGSASGQLAGTLLGQKRKRDRKDFQKALLASAIFESFGALQKQQKQTIIDNAENVKEKYSDIFNMNKAEYDSYASERDEVKRYLENKEVYLNENVKRIIDNTDEVSAARVTWDEVDDQPKELRDKMYAAYNKEYKDLQDRMEALVLNPKVSIKTFEQFNKKAADEYRAALRLVEDDPTKQGLLRSAWNRIFKSEKDPVRAEELREAGLDVTGNMVSTNSELIELQDAMIKAKEERSTFRDSLDKKIKVNSFYKPLVFRDKERDMGKIYLDTVVPLKNYLVSIDEKYKNTTIDLFKTLVDTVVADDPGIPSKDIAGKAFTLIANEEIDIDKYLNAEGHREANGKLLIEEYEGQSDSQRKEAFENDPTLLAKVVDAYSRQGQSAMAGLISDEYKYIYAGSKLYIPNAAEKQNIVEKIKSRLDSKKDKLLLNDSAMLGDIASDVAIAINHYTTRVNREWQKEGYDETQLLNGAIDFVFRKIDSGENLLNSKMTSMDLQGVREERFSPALIDRLPKFIKELKDEGRTDDFEVLRNSYVEKISQLTDTSDDEKIDLVKMVDNIFENENISLEKIIVSSTGNLITGESIVENNPKLNEVDFNPNPVIGGYYLKNADQLIASMDLRSLSNGQLLALRLDAMPKSAGQESSLPQKLGLPEDISLDERKTSGLLPGLDVGDLVRKPKVREQLRDRVERELKLRKYNGPIMMAKPTDLEPIPQEWWDQYMIKNPVGISEPRGAAGRGTKYNPQG